MCGSNIFIFGGLKTSIYLKAALKKEKAYKQTKRRRHPAELLQKYMRGQFLKPLENSLKIFGNPS